MKKLILLAGLFTSLAATAQVLYQEGFEGFAPGAYVSDSPIWDTWSGANFGSAEDAQISNEIAHNGSNSLHIYGNQGPMDVIMVVGLESGAYEYSFYAYVPSGAAGYYNFQESPSPGVGWAFECFFNGDGTMTFIKDQATVLGGTFAFDQWFQMKHRVDMDNDTVEILHNGVSLGSFVFDSAFGAVNFFGTGSGNVAGSMFVDDVVIEEGFSTVAVKEPARALTLSFGPNPANEYVTLSSSHNTAKVRILSLNGQVMLERQVSGLTRGERLNFNLPGGIYFLELTSGTARTMQRLVVSK